MDAVIRPGTAEDGHALGQLRFRWRAEERGETGIDRERFVNRFASWTAEHLAINMPFVASVDDQIVGMAWLVISHRPPTPSRLERYAGDIQSVYVLPDYRNQGIGAKLINTILRYVKKREFVALTVHSAIPAIDFYMRMGFVDDEQWLAYPLT